MKFKSFALILLVFHKAVRSFKDLPEQFLANENVKLLLFREERRYFDAKIFCQEKDAELIYINTTEKFNLLKTFYKLQYSVKPDKNQLIWFNNEEEFGDASASCTAFSIIESVSDNRFQKNCKDNLPFVCEVPRKTTDWKTFRNFSYFVTESNSLTRNEAESHCKSMASNLAFAVLPDVSRFLFLEIIQLQEETVWIDGEYISDNELWYFPSVDSSYTEQIPLGSLFEKCLTLQFGKDDNSLVVSDCNEELNAICQRPKRQDVLKSFNCNGKYYELYKYESNIHEARQACQKIGVELATPSMDELLCFYEQIQDKNLKIWVDSSNINNETCQGLYSDNPILQTVPCDKDISFVCEFEEDSSWKTFGDREYKLLKKKYDGSYARMKCEGMSFDKHLVLALEEADRQDILPIISKITDQDLTDYIYVQGNYIEDKYGWLFAEIPEIITDIPNLQMDPLLEGQFSCLKYKIPIPELVPSDCDQQLKAVCAKPKNDTSLAAYTCGRYYFELFLSTVGVNSSKAEDKCQEYGYDKGLAQLDQNYQFACFKIILENSLSEGNILVKNGDNKDEQDCFYMEFLDKKLQKKKTDCTKDFFNYLCIKSL